jgi:hypothetical protein
MCAATDVRRVSASRRKTVARVAARTAPPAAMARAKPPVHRSAHARLMRTVATAKRATPASASPPVPGTRHAASTRQAPHASTSRWLIVVVTTTTVRTRRARVTAAYARQRSAAWRLTAWTRNRAVKSDPRSCASTDPHVQPSSAPATTTATPVKSAMQTGSARVASVPGWFVASTPARSAATTISAAAA